MAKVAVVSSEAKAKELTRKLESGGFLATALDHTGIDDSNILDYDVLLIDLTSGQKHFDQIGEAAVSEGSMPVIALLDQRSMPGSAWLREADDFLVEPFSEEELRLRIERLVAAPTETGLIEVGGLVVDLDTYEVRVDGRLLALTFKEYELLKFLIVHPNRVWTRQALLNQVWEYDYYGGARTVDVHIRRLRSKLGSRRAGLIKTIRQVGYRFDKV